LIYANKKGRLLLAGLPNINITEYYLPVNSLGTLPFFMDSDLNSLPQMRSTIAPISRTLSTFNWVTIPSGGIIVCA
tara:strand:- start:213 stop:440 length:228 start_codon:yes stop_codon:yes gene_type:complete